MSDFRWEQEAARVAAAFGVSDGWTKFDGIGIYLRDWRGRQVRITGSDVGLNSIAVYPDVSECFYKQLVVYLRASVMVSKCHKNSSMALQMTRGLFCLGYDTASLESQFDLTITAHERCEWLREYRLEMKRAGFAPPSR